MLQEKDGFTMCKELRENNVLIPYSCLIAKDSLVDKVIGFSEGADTYLTKPFSFEELRVLIQALLQKSQNYMTGSLKVTDLELDPLQRTAQWAGRPITLSGKEIALLEYLLRNKGIILSHSKIIDHVWDRNYDGTCNLINGYINHLKAKINKDTKVKLNKTVRGQGNKINEN